MGLADFAGDLIDLVDVNDAPLASLDIVIGGLKQAHQDVFDILADITGLGQNSGIGDGERHMKQLGQSLGNEGFAGARSGR